MPFDASPAAVASPSRPELLTPGPSTADQFMAGQVMDGHPAARAPIAHRTRTPAAESVVAAVEIVAAQDPSAPATVPFYSARYPRPVAAIAPRFSRGVI